MTIAFIVIGTLLIFWGIACVVFREPFAGWAKRYNDGYHKGFLQPPDMSPAIVALFGVAFAGAGIALIVTALLGNAGS